MANISVYVLCIIFSSPVNSIGTTCTEKHPNTLHSATNGGGACYRGTVGDHSYVISQGIHHTSYNWPSPNAFHFSPNTDIWVCICHGCTHLQKDYRSGHRASWTRPALVQLPDLYNGSLCLPLRLVVGRMLHIWNDFKCNWSCGCCCTVERVRLVPSTLFTVTHVV